MADMTVAYSPSHGLGEEQSIWFKLSSLLTQENPMQVLSWLSEKYGGVIPINLKNHRIVILSEPAHAQRVLVDNADNYVKYFDGLRPIFGKSMITVDGALWQKIRAPQQGAFHPGMFEEYFPYLMSAIDSKMARWAKFASTGETIEMVEETWTLAAEMVCKALFDREMPFNPHFIFGQVKTYTDVMNHKSIRLKKMHGELTEITDEDTAKAMEIWGEIPETVIGANIVDHRDKTLLKMLEAAEADPSFPEFDRQQVVDEMKQYLWAGTETTALTLAWSLYLLSQHPEALERIRAEARAVCGDRDPVWNEVQQLGFTRMVIQETMRLFPPIWGLIRIAADDDVIEGHQMQRRQGGDLHLCDASQPEILGRAREVRSGAVRAGALEEAGEVQLPAVRRRQARLYRRRAVADREHAGPGATAAPLHPGIRGAVPAKIHATVTLCPKGGLPFRIRALS